MKGIATEMEGKSEEEVERYAEVFKQNYKELNGEIRHPVLSSFGV